MESLKQKTYKTYDYISRYQPFPYYYNEEDKKYIKAIIDRLDDTEEGKRIKELVR